MTSAQIAEMDLIKEGQRLCVAFIQQDGYTVAIVHGRILPVETGWTITSRHLSVPTKSMGFILKTDRVAIHRTKRGTVTNIGVYLRGRRMPK